MLDSERINLPKSPDQKINVKKIFGIDSDLRYWDLKKKLNGFQKSTQLMCSISTPLCLFLQALSMIEEL